MGGLNTPLQLSASNRDPSLAYSTTSRSFLVTWSQCQPQNCVLLGLRLGLSGEPLGGAFEIGSGRSEKVASNPIAGEFGVVFERCCLETSRWFASGVTAERWLCYIIAIWVRH
jgi:hypothetical protein